MMRSTTRTSYVFLIALAVWASPLCCTITAFAAENETSFILYVSKLGDDTTGGGTSETPFNTITKALSIIPELNTAPGEIHIASGVYMEHVKMRPYVNLRGGYDPIDWTQDFTTHATILDGEKKYGDSIIIGSTGTLQGFWIRNGNSSFGGAIYSYYPLRLEDCKITDCSRKSIVIESLSDFSTIARGVFSHNYFHHYFIFGAGVFTPSVPIADYPFVESTDRRLSNWESYTTYSFGGGVYCWNGVFERCTFLRNSVMSENQMYDDFAYASAYGGAVYSNNNLRFTDCVFERNSVRATAIALCDLDDQGRYVGYSTSQGGAVCCRKRALFCRCRFEENSATGCEITSGCPLHRYADVGEGGAVYCDEGAVFEQCTFISNPAMKTGSVDCRGPSEFLSCVIAKGSPNGISLNHDGYSYAMNNTFVENGNCGILCYKGTLSLWNNIFYNHDLAELCVWNKEQLHPVENNLIESHNNSLIAEKIPGGATATQIATVNEWYKTTTNIGGNPLFAPWSYRLQASSPCIDAGTVTSATGDVRGWSRLYGANQDIGAYEYHGHLEPTLPPDPTPTTTPSRTLTPTLTFTRTLTPTLTDLPTSTPTYPGDLNRDGYVGPEDILEVLKNWDRKPPEVITIHLPGIYWARQLSLVRILSGTFEMGNTGTERDLYYPETSELQQDQFPRHTVTITQDFYIGEVEITFDQWMAVSGPHRAIPINTSCVTRYDTPCFDVNWEECALFIQDLSRETGKTFRLPTEAEWEYACRGTLYNPYRYDLFSFGDHPNHALGSVFDPYFDQYMVWSGNHGVEKPGSIWYCGPKWSATRLPNDYGLYDMHGNLLEWCQDWYQADFYSTPEASLPDPVCQNPSSGKRVLRGGSYDLIAAGCKSNTRYAGDPSGNDNEVHGFRVVMEVEPTR